MKERSDEGRTGVPSLTSSPASRHAGKNQDECVIEGPSLPLAPPDDAGQRFPAMADDARRIRTPAHGAFPVPQGAVNGSQHVGSHDGFFRGARTICADRTSQMVIACGWFDVSLLPDVTGGLPAEKLSHAMGQGKIGQDGAGAGLSLIPSILGGGGAPVSGRPSDLEAS